MLHRLCRPPSIPLSFGLATVLPRRSVSRVSWAPDPRRPRANTHRLRHGLPGGRAHLNIEFRLSLAPSGWD
ncbi:hypothetical protein QVD17_37850 [Tagetes erecta]|uniref:Uncharacterized protein n=1 Tax=Tagetes erecta TaxID=13708 RepID=A0AAD8NKE6_TARER|nr:hypothetical protein QVD17_37850 [Tagetes erecta]